MTKNIAWKVKGANWEKVLQAPADSCALEVATSAIEKIWENQTTTEKTPSVGFILQVSHQNMKSPSEHILVLSALVMANAGFHSESTELNRLWEEQKNPQ